MQEIMKLLNVEIINAIEESLKLYHSLRVGFYTSDAIDFTNTNAIAAAALISSRDFSSRPNKSRLNCRNTGRWHFAALIRCQDFLKLRDISRRFEFISSKCELESNRIISFI